jgi:hypothetical protein
VGQKLLVAALESDFNFGFRSCASRVSCYQFLLLPTLLVQQLCSHCAAIVKPL